MSFYDDALGPEKGLGVLVGKNIVEIFMDEDYLVFIDEDGQWYGFAVEGDCCSHSYFHDFHGVEKLLENGEVKSVGYIDLDKNEIYKTQIEELDNDNDYDVIAVYGYEIVTESPLWGEQTSVFSFRNSSNGYYGGWMYKTDHIPNDFCSDENRLVKDKL